ncbi:hypothetical protein GOBAR_AA25462 [Gossypium barbadense]|uniref:Uncharacterized protein n=1 Tax=Gossypium barbadense TaxID=3634 RepID=A0A2P5WVT8_GOSBA|nr:hypothetical protein GOBAR_AA25462 [Gossypium barbadense]
MFTYGETSQLRAAEITMYVLSKIATESDEDAHCESWLGIRVLRRLGRKSDCYYITSSEGIGLIETRDIAEQTGDPHWSVTLARLAADYWDLLGWGAISVDEGAQYPCP